MTKEDVKAIKNALDAKHSAEADLQKAFIEQRPTEEIDNAIRKHHQTRDAYNSLSKKFFPNWPG